MTFFIIGLIVLTNVLTYIYAIYVISERAVSYYEMVFKNLKKYVDNEGEMSEAEYNALVLRARTETVDTLLPNYKSRQ